MRDGRPSRTAQHNALFRALDARRPAPGRIADDRLAVRFLPPAFRVIAGIARVPPVLRVVEAVIDRRWPGPRSGVVVRTRLLDDEIRSALPDIEQMVILGAGFDTRAYRLDGIDHARVFEVDHPSTQARKQRTVRRAIGRLPAHVTFVPVELGRDDVRAALDHAGFVRTERSLVVWEGVTNYLTSDAVDATFEALAGLLVRGSLVLFTYIDRAMIEGTQRFAGAAESSRHVDRVGEPYTFGFDPSEVGDYLAGRGYSLAWDVTVPQAARRYDNGERHALVNGYGYYHVVRAERT